MMADPTRSLLPARGRLRTLFTERHSVERMYGFNGFMKHPIHQTIETIGGMRRPQKRISRVRSDNRRLNAATIIAARP